MNYEELYTNLTALEKNLKESSSTVTKLYKNIVKDTESGNLADLRKCLDQLSEAASLLSQRVEEVSAQAESFDTREYFAGGDFTRQLLECCDSLGIDVKGSMGVYEMFPYKVRVAGDMEHAGEVYIDRKKIASVRPAYVAQTVKNGRDRLLKGSFNETAFMNELAEAYDITCLKSGLRNGTNVALGKIYRAMTPMARARKEYDAQAFAFDLARIYERGTDFWVTKTGRRFDFGTSRDGKTGIRVLSSSGVESYISTLKPLNNVEE